VYKLTDAADDFFPEDYRSLTGYLLDEVSTRLGKTGVGELFNNIANRLVIEAPPPKENQTFEERLNEVIGFLSERGFSVSWETENNGYVIHARSCPYRRIAKDHSEICLLDRQIISTMLNTVPTRIACLASGDDHCAYRVFEPIELMLDSP
ncbi:MAG: methanogen output domain 1-containing protein, partial [Chloroflexota bacterium]